MLSLPLGLSHSVSLLPSSFCPLFGIDVPPQASAAWCPVSWRWAPSTATGPVPSTTLLWCPGYGAKFLPRPKQQWRSIISIYSAKDPDIDNAKDCRLLAEPNDLDLSLKGLDKRRTPHGLGFHYLVIQHGLNFIHWRKDWHIRLPICMMMEWYDIPCLHHRLHGLLQWEFLYIPKKHLSIIYIS